MGPSLNAHTCRELVDAFCADVWPQEYSSSMLEVGGSADAETLQV